MMKTIRQAKPFLVTMFWKQNKHHHHGVLVHTLLVMLALLKRGHYRMLAAGLLHDVGKPFVAHQKPEDVEVGEYSFTGHEECSYQIISWVPFVSNYTKDLVRYHYLIRQLEKAKEKNLAEAVDLEKLWLSLSDSLRKDLAVFMKCDDIGKR